VDERKGLDVFMAVRENKICTGFSTPRRRVIVTNCTNELCNDQSKFANRLNRIIVKYKCTEGTRFYDWKTENPI
jgi:hypothetical protein